MSTPRVRVVALWAIPRSLSTVTMYSFAQHSCVDEVYDEPLYASYLHRTGVDHIGREDVISAGNVNERQVIEEIFEKHSKRVGVDHKVVFMKNMPKFVTGKEWLARTDVLNVFLTRDPAAVLAREWEGKWEPTMEELCYQSMSDLYQFVAEEGKGPKPVVVDAKHLQLDPSGVLGAVLSHAGFQFEEGMLSWETGPKPYDGAFAKHWYHNLWKSSTFTPYRAVAGGHSVILKYEQLCRQCVPLYNKLRRHAVRRAETRVYVGLGTDVHDAFPDGRNADLQVWVGNGLKHRDDAKVSVFDSAVQGGDMVWEGSRVYEGKIFALDYHLDRLFFSAHALMYAGIPTREFVRNAIMETLRVNDMRDGVHMRITLTRGEKVTSSMNPLFNRSGCTLIVLAEYKDPVYNNNGIRLISSSNRRASPSTVDSKVHHGNMLGLIMAKIQANLAGVDDAIMLDECGFVAETNATNLFIVVRPHGRPDHVQLITPLATHCLPGITRAIVLELANEDESIEVLERRVSLTEVYSSAECFTTGTMGELSPVVWVDGRWIGGWNEEKQRDSNSDMITSAYPVTARLQESYRVRWENTGDVLPF